MLLGIPARLKNGFLPMPLRIAPSSLALVPLQRLIEVVFNDNEWRHPPPSSTFFEGALYGYFQTLCKFLRQCFKVHITVVYDAFRVAGGLALGEDCLCHALFGAMVEAYVMGFMTPSTTLVRSVVHNQLDYLFELKSANLLHASLTLGIQCSTRVGARDALLGLAKSRMQDVVWEDCLTEMRRIVDADASDEWFERQRLRIASELDVEEVKHGVRQALSMLENLRGVPLVAMPLQEVVDVHGISVELRRKY
ncbi:hypothetical protein BDZ89DRAFT_1143331 [Hymenopellis radicata]|nr:hypothetical protein BDZ89DRAFT_1143331 [Hymenopellis radicata]